MPPAARAAGGHWTTGHNGAFASDGFCFFFSIYPLRDMRLSQAYFLLAISIFEYET